MVYTSVYTINHKPRHGTCTTVLYNAIARRAFFGHGWCTWLLDCGAALLLTVKIDQILHMRRKVTSASAGEDALTVQLPLRVTQLSRCYLC